MLRRHKLWLLVLFLAVAFPLAGGGLALLHRLLPAEHARLVLFVSPGLGDARSGLQAPAPVVAPIPKALVDSPLNPIVLPGIIGLAAAAPSRRTGAGKTLFHSVAPRCVATIEVPLSMAVELPAPDAPRAIAVLEKDSSPRSPPEVS